MSEHAVSRVVIVTIIYHDNITLYFKLEINVEHDNALFFQQHTVTFLPDCLPTEQQNDGDEKD